MAAFTRATMIARTLARSRSRRVLLLLLVGLAAAGGASPRAQGAAEILPLLTHPAEVYRLGTQGDGRRYRFLITASVTYYDPLWNQFYGWDGTDTFYMTPPVGSNFSIQPGQWVRLTGEIQATGGFKAENLRVEVLRPVNEAEVMAVAGRLGDSAALKARLVDVEGLVDWQEQLDPFHLRLSLISEGRRLTTTVRLYQEGRAPLLTGAMVRARGIFLPRLDINQHQTGIELKVQGVENLRVIGRLATEPMLDSPPVRIADLGPQPAGARVHVAGRVDAFEPGHHLTLRDATGTLEIRTAQELGLRVGAEIDALGLRAAEGAELHLEQGLWRLREGASPPNVAVSRGALESASQVLALSAERAAAGQPVVLSGVVTWAADGSRFFYLQDRTGGIRVSADPGITFEQITPGLSVRVNGVSSMGAFAPEVVFRQVQVSGAMSPPEPQRISLEEAETGASEGRWVEMEGYVRTIEPAGPWTQLDLITATGEFQALLQPRGRIDDKVGTFVRLRGVCDSIANEFHRSTGIRLWVPPDEHIDLDESPIGDVFSIPFAPLESLGRFGSERTISRRVHTGGTVTYQKPGSYLIIQTGPESLVIRSRDKQVFAVGDLLDAVGLPGWDGTRILLREGAVRKVGHDADLRPFELTRGVPVTDRFDCRLVRLKGLLSEVIDLGDEYFLTIQTGTGTVVARLAHANSSGLPDSWRKGSTVQATGVYRLRFDENRAPNGIDLMMRGDADLVVLQSPPWWTIERAMDAAGLLSVCVLGVILWVVSLRRTLQTQTLQIRRQSETQSRMEVELERSQRLHSLGLLAGGIAHDFNNLLAVIMGNLSLARMDEAAEEAVGDSLRDAEEGTRRAHRLTQQLLTFARGGDPVCTPLWLPGIVTDAVTLALSGSKSRAEFNPPGNLWPVYADEGQLGCAVQNMVAHASAEMPAGGVVEIEAANEAVQENATRPLAPGRYVRLTVIDHGPGIPDTQRGGIFDPYAAAKRGKNQFGLAAAYSIVQKHRGFIEAVASAERGNALRIWIPASDAVPVPAPGRPVPLGTR